MKRCVALVAAVLLLSGCSIPVLEYPYLPAGTPDTKAAAIKLVLPADGDELLQSAMTTLEAKVLELGEEKLQIKSRTEENVLTSYQSGGVGLYLLSSMQIAQLDRQLAFAGMPYLFSGSDKLMPVLNDQDGFVSASPEVRDNLGGEVLGAYYRGSTLLLNSNKYFEELGFYGAAGILTELGASEGFTALGIESQVLGTQQEILEAFVSGTVRLCEIRLDTVLSAEVLAKVKSIELTNHRYDCWWLVLRGSDELDGRTVNILKEAFAYTRRQYDTGRVAQDTAQMDSFLQQHAELVQERDGFAAARMLTREYYRDNQSQLDIPEKVWSKILELR